MKRKLSKMDRVSRFIYGSLMLMVFFISLNPIFILGLIPLYNSIFGLDWIYKLMNHFNSKDELL